MHMEGVKIEIIGSFLWISGNTKPYKEQLKELGMKWSRNKEAWYLSPEGYKRYSKKVYNMDEIRNMYGNHVMRDEKKDKEEKPSKRLHGS